MKNRSTILLIAVTVFSCAASAVRAQVAQTVSITATVLRPRDSVDNHGTTTTPAPQRFALTTAAMLSKLASDENLAGNFDSDKFPAGAKLVYIAGTGLQVWDRHNTMLVDVSDVLTLTVTGANDLTSGASNDNAGDGNPPFTKSDVQIWTLTYDNTGLGETRKVSITGAATSTVATTKPAANGAFTETDSFRFQNGTGEGIDDEGVPIILTGFTITATGTARVLPAEASSGPILGFSH